MLNQLCSGFMSKPYIPTPPNHEGANEIHMRIFITFLVAITGSGAVQWT